MIGWSVIQVKALLARFLAPALLQHLLLVAHCRPVISGATREGYVGLNPPKPGHLENLTPKFKLLNVSWI